MTTEIKKKIAAILFAVMFSVSACGKADDVLKESDERDLSSETVQSTESKTKTKNKKNDNEYESAYVYAAGGRIDCDEKQTTALSNAVDNLNAVEFDGLTLLSDYDEWQLYMYGDEGEKTYTRHLTTNGWRIIDNDMNCYEDSPELTELIIDSISHAGNMNANFDTEYYTIEYDEPNTEEEYTNAAVACTDAWLTSLQSEDTDEYYRNKSFEITVYEESSYTQKCNYLSCGMVNGKKEFVVEICFTAEDYGENTFYDDYYQEGRYTEAGTFWSGQYICGRFRWEDGKCSLIKMTTRDGSSGIQSGLNGIQTNKYKNFFEFAKRADYEDALNKSFESYGIYTVSKNLTQTEDGKPINIDIYAFNINGETDDTYTAIWDERAYINKEATYSTGLYFTDGGTGHMPDTLPKDFSLTFDNYDGDANPDFCCRYDSDEEGTFYVLESIQTDGRIFNLSGRAFEGGIYIAGCSDPSPRLQKTDGIAYIGWKIDEDGYYPTDTNGNKIQLPELNMYSDRYYMPDDLKLYSEDENKVTCFLWNNTESGISTDSAYSIEVNEAGEWRTVSDGLSVESTSIKPHECAEITYDISSITDRYNTVYRIVQKSGELTAYGNFCLEGKDIQNLEISADDIFVGANCGSFSVTDHGLYKTEITSAYIKDGNKEYPLIINSSGSECYSFVSEELPEKSGTYKLVVNDSAECEIELKNLPGNSEISVEPSINEESIILLITPDSECRLTDIKSFKKQGNNWEVAALAPNDDTEYMLNKKEKSEIILLDMYPEVLNDDSVKYFYESFKDEIAEYGEVPEEMAEIGITDEMDYNEFKSKIKDYYAFSPDSEYMVIIDYEFDDVAYQQYILV